MLKEKHNLVITRITLHTVCFLAERRDGVWRFVTSTADECDVPEYFAMKFLCVQQGLHSKSKVMIFELLFFVWVLLHRIQFENH